MHIDIRKTISTRTWIDDGRIQMSAVTTTTMFECVIIGVLCICIDNRLQKMTS